MNRISEIINMRDEFIMNYEFRRSFRITIREDLKDLEELQKLPYLKRLSMGPAIDANTMVRLNNLMDFEEKKRFLTDVLNFKNINFNAYYLILNSSYKVREYVTELLAMSAVGLTLDSFEFYDIANIYLYMLANNESKTFSDILTPLNNAMRMYNCTKSTPVLNILQNTIIKDVTIGSNTLDLLNFKTDEQLEEHKNNFYKQIEEQEQENKKNEQNKKLKIIGISLICQAILISLGFPPLSRIVTSAVKNILTSDN